MAESEMQDHDSYAHLIKNYLEYMVRMGFNSLMIPEKDFSSDSYKPDLLSLESIRTELADCTRCRLHEKRHTMVFGEGNPHARLMFVGEGPGADEDAQGRPFVGKAGQLLTRMILAMKFKREDVYIANIVKCRPPGNRDPEQDEIDTCLPFLKSQIRAIQPDVIVTLGRIAAKTLLNTNDPLNVIRGRIYDVEGIPLIPTYHPSFLLRQESDKRFKAMAWEDLQKAMALLESRTSRTEYHYE
jgi:DNA polymerase